MKQNKRGVVAVTEMIQSFKIKHAKQFDKMRISKSIRKLENCYKAYRAHFSYFSIHL